MNETPIRFDGEVAIVTGAGSGLGRGHALELAARGAAVVCNDVVGGAALGTVEEIARRGGIAVPDTHSVATAEGGEAIVGAAIDAFGSVEIVINNAGQLRNAAFEEMSIEDFDDVLRTHLAGAFYVTQPAYRHMKAGAYGRIIFTSSGVGMFGYPWSANYAAAKAGLIGLCKVVALEGARHAITANAILPMALGTGMGGDGRPPYGPEQLEEVARALEPAARYMTVDNVTPFVVYLASRQCSLTNRIFSVGCGRVAEAFVAVSRGWYAPDASGSTPEETAVHLDAACDRAGFGVPQHAFDEFRLIAEHMPG
jgi:NAD(P)-dependent dehydrogenase (short-subunit alcohol dehydrogenase family)